MSIVMVQSELYLGPQGQPGDYAKMLAGEPTRWCSTATSTSTSTHRIKVDPGQRIRIWVLDAGPNDISSFHIVGTISTPSSKKATTYSSPATRPEARSQALDLDPAQGGFVETSLCPAGHLHHGQPQVRRRQPGALGTFDVGGVTGAMNH